MKQVLQSLQTGKVDLVDVPASRVSRGTVLIRTSRTLISAGTERMLLQFGKANWIEKARQQPDKFRSVLDKLKTDGILPTLESVRAKLDQPIALGYSNVGVVLETGPGVQAFRRGDRVVSNGNHSELVRVGQNLCARVPDGVSDEDAAFAVVGAIALQGIRLADPKLGETFAVTGLGLIGLLAVQILIASGCRVLGIDLDPQKLELARSFGAETLNIADGGDPVAIAEFLTKGHGLDGVLITATTTSSTPVRQAALMCRKRGRIVLVGVSGLDLVRDDFYKKELTFQVSCSYGPGRYDPTYEQDGIDYPFPYVRWTEQRNIEAVLQLIADDRIRVGKLVSHRFPIHEVQPAYELLDSKQPYLGILLEYPSESEMPEATLRRETVALLPQAQSQNKSPSVSVIGAGQFASKVLIPALCRSNLKLDAIASSGGINARHCADKFGFARVTTDLDSIFADPSASAVVIATQHDSHAQLIRRAIESGKHIYVEKPLCVTREELDEIDDLYRTVYPRPLLMVGFNRRFSRMASTARQLLASLPQPKSLVYTVNAGPVPSDHWTQTAKGGGRIIGEACHFIDLVRFLISSPIANVKVSRTGQAPDTLSITVECEDASCGTVHYFSNGHKRFPKERVEVFCGGRILQLDNFRRLRAFGWPGFKSMKLWRQDKGHAACMAAFAGALTNGLPSPIPFDQIVEVMRATFTASES